MDLAQLAFLKSAKTNGFHAGRHIQTAFSASRHGNQLPAVLAQQQAILRFVVGVVGIHRKGGQIAQCHEAVFSNVGHIGRNMQFGQTRVVEGIAHQADAFVVTEGDMPQCLQIAERIVVDQCDAVRQNDSGQLGIHKRLLRDLFQLDPRCKGHRLQAASLEHTGTHGCQRCRQGHLGQILRICEGVLLHNRQLPIRRKGQGLDGCIGKGLSANEGHIRWDLHTLQPAALEGLRLDHRQRFRQHQRAHCALCECAATDDGDAATKIHQRQIHMRFRSQIFQNADIAGGQDGILEIAVFLHGFNAQVITLNVIVPVFIQICRQGLRSEIQIRCARSQEGIAADMLHTGRDRQLRQPITAIEGVAANIGQRFRQRQTPQVLAESEGKVINIGQFCITEVDDHQLAHTLQSMCLETGQRTARLKGDHLQIVTAVKHIGRDAIQLAVGSKGKDAQIPAPHKYVLGHGGHVGRHTEAGKTAIGKSTIAQSGQLGSIAKGNIVHLPAVGKGIATNLRDMIRNMNRIHIFTIRKTILTDLHQRIRQLYPIQVGCTGKGPRCYDLRCGFQCIVLPCLTCRISMDHSIIQGVDHAIDIMVHLVALRNSDRRQIRTQREHAIAQFLNTSRNGDFPQPTFRESEVADFLQALGQCD